MGFVYLVDFRQQFRIIDLNDFMEGSDLFQVLAMPFRSAEIRIKFQTTHHIKNSVLILFGFFSFKNMNYGSWNETYKKNKKAHGLKI